jgi:RND family efflux transporter MFP subunit
LTRLIRNRPTLATILFIPGLFFLLLSAMTAPVQAADRPMPVRVATVEKQQVSEQVSLVGTTEPDDESTVAAEVAGIVDRFPVEEGDYVEKGALLAKLRTTYIQLRLNEARAAREQTLANLKNAEKELQRVSKLRQTNAVAEKAYDEALYSHQALSQGLLRHEAEIEQLRYELEQASIKAPFTGFVAREHTAVGQYLSAGGAVVDLIKLNPVLVTIDVPERYILRVPVGAGARVVLPSISDQPYQAQVFAVLPRGNPSARTFPVRVRMENPEYRIKSGMEALVSFDLSGAGKALLVPKDAVVPAGETRKVFRVVDGKVEPVLVKIVGYFDGNVAVEGPLNVGDQVVIRGNERLRPGQEVAILE